jgi:hypothetical protein
MEVETDDMKRIFGDNISLCMEAFLDAFLLYLFYQKQ